MALLKKPGFFSRLTGKSDDEYADFFDGTGSHPAVFEGEGEESKDKDLGEEIDDPPFADERHKGEKCDDDRKGDWLGP